VTAVLGVGIGTSSVCYVQARRAAPWCGILGVMVAQVGACLASRCQPRVVCWSSAGSGSSISGVGEQGPPMGRPSLTRAVKCTHAGVLHSWGAGRPPRRGGLIGYWQLACIWHGLLISVPLLILQYYQLLMRSQLSHGSAKKRRGGSLPPLISSLHQRSTFGRLLPRLFHGSVATLCLGDDRQCT
jgi:hypothetical protein